MKPVVKGLKRNSRLLLMFPHGFIIPMTRKYFGTDGIRGQANKFPVTAEMALRVAMAAAEVFRAENTNGHKPRILIGKDTRLSCYMLEQALTAGFLSMGMDVLLTGPIPTPAVAMLTRSLRADAGIMISASHNKYMDNGIKIFAGDGYKLPDEIEQKIEALIDANDFEARLSSPEELGRAARIDDAPFGVLGRYMEFLKSSLPKGADFRGLKVVVDAANGAAYKVAPMVLWELEAEVISIGVSPNGKNINEHCGATATEMLQAHVLEQGADIGIALDGDADRLILVNEVGHRVDGDQILALLATHMKEQEKLHFNTLVATVMSNLGLERYCVQQGITFTRTPVGDRYVVEEMRRGGFTLGGEQSGHMILSEFGTTGDGLLTALQVLHLLKTSGKKASQLLHVFDPLPQLLKNVRYENGNPLEDVNVQQTIDQIKSDLESKGRVLVRASGTEPVIRVMAEGDDQHTIETVVDKICAVIEDVGKRA